ncbi:MAG: hypothetical protein ABSH53_22135 [Holophaga sp.]
MKRLGGWWRLWVLLSVIWIAGCIIAAVSLWPSRLSELNSQDLAKLPQDALKLVYSPFSNPSKDATLITPIQVDLSNLTNYYDFDPPPKGSEIFDPNIYIPAPDAFIFKEPITDETIYILKHYDKESIHNIISKLNDAERTNLMTAIDHYNSSKHKPFVFHPVNGSAFLISPDANLEQMKFFRAEYLKGQRLKLSKTRLFFVSGVFSFLVLPPVLLLLFSLSIRWVYHGFRKEPT